MLEGHNYEGILYETDTILISNAMSQSGIEFFDELEDLTEDEADIRIKAEAEKEGVDPVRIEHFRIVKYRGDDPRKGDENDGQELL